MLTVVQRNTIRTYAYMIGLTVIIGVLGTLISTYFNFGLSGTGVFLILAGIVNFIAYFYSDRFIILSTGAKPLAASQAPEYAKLVKELCKENNLPLPKLYYLDEDAMNAFATGRDYNHAALAVTRGLLEKLTPNEIKGVLGHELSHIKNYDMRVMAVVTILAGIISILADMYWRAQAVSNASGKDNSGVLAIIGVILSLFAPITAMFIQLSISRKREFMADASGAEMVKNPNFLASALRKISRDHLPLPAVSATTAHLFISNPLKNDGLIDRMFSTHPPLEERIAQLEKMKGSK